MLKKYFEILHYYILFSFLFFRLKIVQSTEVEMDSLKILASPSSPLLSIAKNPSGNQIVIFKTVKILISIVQPLMSHIDLNSLGPLVLLVMTNATSILLSMGAEVILVHPEGYPDIIRRAWSHLPFLAHLRVTTTLPRIQLETILTLQKIFHEGPKPFMRVRISSTFGLLISKCEMRRSQDIILAYCRKKS